MTKPKVLFVYDHEYPDLWRDGLWSAIKLLENDFEITWHNIQNPKIIPTPEDYDFVLGWGGFQSAVDELLRSFSHFEGVGAKLGLCIGGNAMPPFGLDAYDVLFYETEWYRPQIEHHKHIVHAFGVNTDIYFPTYNVDKVWDYLTCGAFALWKRQEKLGKKQGLRLAIGQIQKGNLDESFGIIATLLDSGCAVSDMVAPDQLAKLYNSSRCVYLPASIVGGGERALLEARACGCNVEIEPDNPKLAELLDSPIWNHHYYAEQLRKGIMSCL